MKQQMQLTFGSSVSFNPTIRRQRRLRRARWWFDQMRQVVDRAVDWVPAAPPIPEQTYFPIFRKNASCRSPKSQAA